MDNQHKLIKGYRDLTQAEISLMNEAKEIGEQLRGFIQRLETLPDVDKRWIAIGMTDLQKGFMGLVRSVARPTTF
jgi:hypothetical protein